MRKNIFIITLAFAATFLSMTNAYGENTQPLPMLPLQQVQTTNQFPNSCLMPAPSSTVSELSIASLESIDVYSTACNRTEIYVSGKGKLQNQRSNSNFEIVLMDMGKGVFNFCLDQLNRSLMDRANVVLRGYIASNVIVPPVVATFDPFAVAIRSQTSKNYFYVTSCSLKR